MTPTEQPRTLSFEELTVWRTELPDVKFAVLPPGNARPNPLIADDSCSFRFLVRVRFAL